MTSSMPLFDNVFGDGFLDKMNGILLSKDDLNIIKFYSKITSSKDNLIKTLKDGDLEQSILALSGKETSSRLMKLYFQHDSKDNIRKLIKKLAILGSYIKNDYYYSASVASEIMKFANRFKSEYEEIGISESIFSRALRKREINTMKSMLKNLAIIGSYRFLADEIIGFKEILAAHNVISARHLRFLEVDFYNLKVKSLKNEILKHISYQTGTPLNELSLVVDDSFKMLEHNLYLNTFDEDLINEILFIMNLKPIDKSDYHHHDVLNSFSRVLHILRRHSVNILCTKLIDEISDKYIEEEKFDNKLRKSFSDNVFYLMISKGLVGQQKIKGFDFDGFVLKNLEIDIDLDYLEYEISVV